MMEPCRTISIRITMTGKNEFTFPFDTCEKPNDDAFAAQPYSVVVNVISCCVVAYFLWKAKTFHATVLLVGLLLFDLSHTFSHFVHIQSSVQITLVHVLAYVLNFSFLLSFYLSPYYTCTFIIV